MSDIVRCTFEGFVGTPDGDVKLVLGDEWAADDRFVKANPQFFTTADRQTRPRRTPEVRP